MKSKFDPALAAAAHQAVKEVLHAADPSREPWTLTYPVPLFVNPKNGICTTESQRTQRNN